VVIVPPDPEELAEPLDPPSEPKPPSEVGSISVTCPPPLDPGPPSLVPLPDPEVMEVELPLGPPSELPLVPLEPPELAPLEPALELPIVAPEPGAPSEPTLDPLEEPPRDPPSELRSPSPDPP
jgi:hypothetical protein